MIVGANNEVEDMEIFNQDGDLLETWDIAW